MINLTAEQRSDRVLLRRSFTPVQKVKHVAAYEAACETGKGGAYLRSEGLFSSQIIEWRKLRDAGDEGGRTQGAGHRKDAMPKSTPARSIRVPENLWQAAKARAEEKGETVTAVIIRALKRYAR